MVVAEALAHGCPAVVSRGAPWAGLETEGCGWWVNNSVENLVVALDAAMNLPQAQLAAMGLRGRAWMERDYGWAAIGQKMDAAYRWILARRRRLVRWVRIQRDISEVMAIDLGVKKLTLADFVWFAMRVASRRYFAC